MNNMNNLLKTIIALLLLAIPGKAHAQEELSVDLSMIDGMEITPDNIFKIRVFSSLDRTVASKVKGSIIYRKSNIRLSYTFSTIIHPGLNTIDAAKITPVYEYSSASLRELFTIYKKMPQGIFEYCVIIDSGIPVHETGNKEFSQCLFHKTEDLFFINLLDPENNARIYEYNPNLSWTASFPFASGLNYRLRVAEMKKGQTAVTAIARNRPVYEESKLYMTSKTYPVYARPLVRDQPYAWTVDAYYKDLLLGGAEPWVFTIIEDSLLTLIPRHMSYYDFSGRGNETRIFALDTLKLKYDNRYLSDSLHCEFFNKNTNEKIAAEALKLPAVEGLNYYDIDLLKYKAFRHRSEYYLKITTRREEVFRVPFIYIDPNKL